MQQGMSRGSEAPISDHQIEAATHALHLIGTPYADDEWLLHPAGYLTEAPSLRRCGNPAGEDASCHDEWQSSQ